VWAAQDAEGVNLRDFWIPWTPTEAGDLTSLKDRDSVAEEQLRAERNLGF